MRSEGTIQYSLSSLDLFTFPILEVSVYWDPISESELWVIDTVEVIHRVEKTLLVSKEVEIYLNCGEGVSWLRF